MRWFDLAGDESDQPSWASAIHPATAVTWADIGRLVIINADLRADDVPALLTAASERAIAEVAPDAQLQDWAPGSPLYLAATALYDNFRRPGIGPVSGRSPSLRPSAWAREFYDAQSARGKNHHAALRALGNRWLEVLWHCLTTSVPYDNAVHVANRSEGLSAIKARAA